MHIDKQTCSSQHPAPLQGGGSRVNMPLSYCCNYSTVHADIMMLSWIRSTFSLLIPLWQHDIRQHVQQQDDIFYIIKNKTWTARNINSVCPKSLILDKCYNNLLFFFTRNTELNSDCKHTKLYKRIRIRNTTIAVNTTRK